MDNFLIGKKVKILVDNIYKNRTGIIQMIYPRGLFTDRTIYQIKLNEHLSGQYTDTQFELLENQ